MVCTGNSARSITAGAPFDLVITVCDHAAQNCGALPGEPNRLHWGLPDPAAHQETQEARRAFSACFDELSQRISGLLDKGLGGEQRPPSITAPLN